MARSRTGLSRRSLSLDAHAHALSRRSRRCSYAAFMLLLSLLDTTCARAARGVWLVGACVTWVHPLAGQGRSWLVGACGTWVHPLAGQGRSGLMGACGTWVHPLAGQGRSWLMGACGTWVHPPFFSSSSFFAGRGGAAGSCSLQLMLSYWRARLRLFSISLPVSLHFCCRCRFAAAGCGGAPPTPWDLGVLMLLRICCRCRFAAAGCGGAPPTPWDLGFLRCGAHRAARPFCRRDWLAP